MMTSTVYGHFNGKTGTAHAQYHMGVKSNLSYGFLTAVSCSVCSLDGTRFLSAELKETHWE